MLLELPDQSIELVAGAVADRIASELSRRFTAESPWLTTPEAIAYSKVPEGTFRKKVAAGHIRSHGGRTKIFHKAELDADLGYTPAEPAPIASLKAA